ncbi:hypothetical protein ACMVR0_004666, partial [Yersinia enterocolitica]
ELVIAIAIFRVIRILVSLSTASISYITTCPEPGINIIYPGAIPNIGLFHSVPTPVITFVPATDVTVPASYQDIIVFLLSYLLGIAE